MNYPTFTKGAAMHVELAHGYALRSAPEREFGINYAIFRNVNPERLPGVRIGS